MVLLPIITRKVKMAWIKYTPAHLLFSLSFHCCSLKTTHSSIHYSDTLLDCNDPDCCLKPLCKDSIPCRSSPNPMEILLRKQSPSSTDSFYERVKFLIEDNSVQIHSSPTSFNQTWDPLFHWSICERRGLGLDLHTAPRSVGMDHGDVKDYLCLAFYFYIQSK